jgi:tetratricopeptide (TPR) repeat protein
METSLDSTPLTKTQPAMSSTTPFGFVQKWLPWVVAAVFLIIYVLTLGRSITYQGISTLSRAAGWDWQPIYHAPLHFLVTYPVRWLPPGWQVIGLNLFSAICAVFTVALLARSVAILPHDRTRDQRQLERNEFSLLRVPAAWLPPVFAVLVCGLQLTFWEHSIISTMETFDLLLFAYCIRCLLEYRLDERTSWLYRVSFILGLAMTSNYAMVGFVPAFVIALIWIRKRSFFNIRFLATMASFGVAGLLLFLLLPLLNSSSPLVDQSFWQLLKIGLGHQKAQLMGFPRYIVLLVALTSLLPVLFMGIKWPNQLGDISAAGNALTNLMTHVIHGVFLLACLYVAFDPPFSPRKLAFGQPMLPFYYLGALSVGYFAGYFLLVFGNAEVKPWHRYRQLRKVLQAVIVGLVWMAALGVPAGLLVKNLPEIRKTSGPYLARMADSMVKSLPPEGGVVLSDDLYRLYTLHDALHRRGLLSRFILLDSGALHNPVYHRHLRQKYGDRCPTELAAYPRNRNIDSGAVANLVGTLLRSQRVFYLQPTFGYYLEYFYLMPKSLVYEFKAYPANVVSAPPIPPDVLKENDVFWRQFISVELPGLRQSGASARAKKGKTVAPERNRTTFAVAAAYSRSLTWLGVQAQRAGELDMARDYFTAALALNPDNPSAFVSLDYNALLRDGKTESTKPSEGAIERISTFGGRWDQIMALNGPVDDPNACQVVAQMFARAGNFRQAAQNLLRIQALNPTAMEPRMLLVGMLVQAHLPDKALELIEQLRNEPKAKPMPEGAQMALIQSEAWAHVFKNDLATAEKVLHAAETKYPGDDTPFSTLIEIYFRLQQTSNALALLDRELTRNPENATALINYAAIKMQNKEYDVAIPMLDKALKTEPDNAYALVNRAIANLQLGRLDDARRDYEHIISKQSRVPHTVHYGLGEIAWRKKSRATALEHYNSFLKTAPAGAEREEVQRRVKRLKEGKF